MYVDLGRLEDEPYRLSKIYDTLGQYIDDIRRQRDIIYISKMAESLDISSLDRYRAQLVDEYDRLGTLKKILDEAYDLYKECNEKFEASGQTLCNLYAETPWYETSEGKLAIGIGVLVVTACSGDSLPCCTRGGGRHSNTVYSDICYYWCCHVRRYEWNSFNEIRQVIL